MSDDPTDLDFFPPEAELYGDYLREEALSARTCPATNPDGTRCTYTTHEGQHTWER